MRRLDIRRMSRAAVAGIAILGLTAIVAYAQPKNEKSAQAAGTPAAPAAQEGVPAGEAPASVPLLGDASKGKGIYETYCVVCHGPQGKGDGPASASLPKAPANHTDGAYMNKLPNEELFKAIKEGGQSVGKSNLMPAWGATLNDNQVKDVLAYVRSLAVPPYTGPR
jgi:mono/diheme cytochrome c family protein